MEAQVTFKNVRAMIFLKLDGADINFWSGPKTLDFFLGRLPLPVSTSPEELIKGGLSNVPGHEPDAR
jgi:hypothetical protein